MGGERLKDLLVVGGGVAAWTAAAVLARSGTGARVRVLADGPGAQGAETTLPQSLGFFGRLGVEEPHLMKAAAATFRLGTRFVDWNEPGHGYVNPLGAHGASIGFVAFHHYAEKARSLGDATDFNAYSLPAQAGLRGRFAHPVDDPNSIGSTLRYALNLDGEGHAGHLRRLAEEAGVESLEGRVAGVEASDGRVEAVVLEGGERRSADFYLDATPDGRLIDALSDDFEEWSDWLPADRIAAATIAPTDASPASLTTIQGLDEGWLRSVPLRNRVHHELVHRGEFLDGEAAAAVLAEAVGVEAGDIAFRGFRPGCRPQPWIGNCLALGEAATSCEPLHQTALQGVHSALTRFVLLMPDQDLHPGLARQYNRTFVREQNNIRDFLAAHYALVQRPGRFWTTAREVEPPPTLDHKQRLFAVHGQVAFFEDETYDEPAWVSLWLGQGQWPDGHDPVLDGYDFDRLKGRFEHMKSLIDQAAGSMPSHGDYLARYSP